MRSFSRRGFLNVLGGTLILGGLSACEAGDRTDEKTKKQAAPVQGLSGVEAEEARNDVRKALMLLFDRAYVVGGLLQNGEVAASTIVCPGIKEPNGSDFAQNAGNGKGKGYFAVKRSKLKKNTDAAFQTLKQYYAWDDKTASFLDFPQINYVFEDDEVHRAIAEYIQEVLAQVGIEMTLDAYDRQQFAGMRDAGGFYAVQDDRALAYADPLSMLERWTSGSAYNIVQFGRGAHERMAGYDLDLTSYGLQTKVRQGTWEQTYDVLIDTIRATSDLELRTKLLHLAEDFIMDTGCVCPLYHRSTSYVISKEVEGHVVTPRGTQVFRGTRFRGSDETLAVRVGGEPTTLDPALVTEPCDATIVCSLFSGLARWVKREEGDFVVEPDCAIELVPGVVNEDGSVTYTYVLREGLMWSDGQPLTAQDFVSAWKRAANKNTTGELADRFVVIRGFGTDDLAVRAVDDRTLEVVLSVPVPYWNELLALPQFFPVQKGLADDDAWAKDAGSCVCNGAYRLSAWESGVAVRVDKRDEYWDAAGTIMRHIDFALTNKADALERYERGELQFSQDVPTSEVARLKTDREGEYWSSPLLGTYTLCWNVNENLLPA